MSAKRKIILAPCNECGRQTDHVILKTQSKVDRYEEDVWFETRYQMIECQGCHFISLERSIRSSEFDDVEIEYFPPPISRRKPSWIGELAMNVPIEYDLPDLLEEVYSALHTNNRRLAAMGARTLLDVAMVNSVGDVGGFDKKLHVMEDKGLIGKQQREFLEAALDTGSAAAHRGHCPNAKQLNHVMDIVENILHQIFVLPGVAKELKSSTPQRKKIGK
jgi:hypothetical protein